ncbi:MAG TPA: MBL fold metallo-hydrolase [Gemmatimonadales bacterium]|nr:MBL fold metallo-hydrolase [Gemmatimonadales bacterium]
MDRQQGRGLQAVGRHPVRFRLILAALALVAAPFAFGSVDSGGTLPYRKLAPGVYAVLGDTGQGVEGRPNAGFVVTADGVVVIDALASPRQGEQLLRTIRRITDRPIVWLVLTHHHPDHHFGAVVLRNAGAKVIAHPDKRALASEGGEDALIADWVRVVGLDAMRGFEFADTPDRPVTSSDTLRLGGKTIVVTHPGAGHSPGDLIVWLPGDDVLFAGDVLVEDGVSMIVDGNSGVLLGALDTVSALRPRLVVPGHGAIPARPADLVRRTRDYLTRLQQEMRTAVETGVPMRRAMAGLPPADSIRPVSLNSRRRRNAVRVYVEEERKYMGLETP